MKKGKLNTSVVGLNVISARIARSTGVSNADTKKVLKAFIKVVGELVRSGAFIIIKGLFSVRILQRNARKTFVPRRDGPGYYTTTPKRSYIRMRPCIPLINGIPLARRKGRSYIKKEER